MTNFKHRFREHYVNLKDIQFEKTEKFNSRISPSNDSNIDATNLIINGKQYKISKRFLLSLCTQAAINPSILNLFDHNEVLHKITCKRSISTTNNVRIIEDTESNSLLAVTKPSKPIIRPANLTKIFNDFGCHEIIYDNGVITGTIGVDYANEIKIANEAFKMQLTLQTPIDGYGSPFIYLSLLRLICTNGIVAQTTKYKTTINLPKNNSPKTMVYTLVRTLESYSSNDFALNELCKKIDLARSSILSMREYQDVYNVIYRCRFKDKSIRQKSLNVFNNMCGEIYKKYGIAHLDNLTKKQLSLLETNTTVYDALNFVSELRTHHVEPESKLECDKWIGDVLSNTFDLEGISNPKLKFKDFYLN